MGRIDVLSPLATILSRAHLPAEGPHVILTRFFFPFSFAFFSLSSSSCSEAHLVSVLLIAASNPRLHLASVLRCSPSSNARALPVASVCCLRAAGLTAGESGAHACGNREACRQAEVELTRGVAVGHARGNWISLVRQLRGSRVEAKLEPVHGLVAGLAGGWNSRLRRGSRGAHRRGKLGAGARPHAAAGLPGEQSLNSHAA